MKKFLLMALVFIMTGGIIFAGGNNQQGPSPSAGSGSAPAQSSVQSGEKAAITDGVLNQLGLVKTGGTYRFKETRSITVEVFDRGLDGGRSKPEDNFYTDWIKAGMLRDHNVAVTFKPVNRWAETDELNNLLAAGTAPDVCVTYSYPTILSYATMGGVTDLNPYINGYADLFPNIWEWPGEKYINYYLDPKTRQLWTIGARMANDTGFNVFVRDDWLKKLNIPEPKTLAEFHNMLVAFRDNAQTLLGKDANMMIPFIMGQDVAWQTWNLIGSFIPDDVNDRDWFIHGFDDRNLSRPGSVPGEIAVKSAMRILNQWYQENLIWKDFALYGAGDNIQDNLTKSGYVGAFMQSWDFPYRDGKNSITAVLHTNAGPDANFVAIAPFPNNAGRTLQVGAPIVGTKVFFPVSNKEPLAGLFYIDWIHRKDNLFFLQFGEEGVNHQVQPNGAIKGIAVTGARIMNSPNNIDYTPLINGIMMPDEDLKIKTMVLAYSDVDTGIVERSYKTSSSPRKVLGNANVGPIAAEEGMDKILSEKRDAIYAKAVPASPAQFDAVFDAGYRDWLSSGAQAIINERAAKWKEYYGDKTSVSE